MAAAAGKKTIGAGFSNEIEVVRVRYDFSVDGGATGDLDLLEADGELLITDHWAVVKTTCTSGGSAAVSTGISSDKDYGIDSAAVADLTANAVHRTVLVEGTPNAKRWPLRLADGEKITQTIETATLTAGVIEYVFVCCKA